jgi:hypothetical protein
MATGERQLKRESAGVTVEFASPVRQSRQAVRRSSDLQAWHASLQRRCQVSILSALEKCETSLSLRDDRSPPPLRYVFYLRANVGDDSRLAIWRDRRLLAHPELRARGEVLIDLGETFDSLEAGSPIAAGFDRPLQAALTLIRAADRVLEFDMRLDDINMNYHWRNES